MQNTYQIKLGDQFEGPFDLLLFFIERDELDIYNIPINEITQEFLVYIRKLEELNIEMASEFILFISTLMRIKAKMLLPRREIDDSGNAIDPRQELVDKLLEYKQEMGEVVYQRCLYVVEEILRTKKAAELLKQNDIEGFGKLMFRTHDGLKNLYNVSCVELDFLVDFASKNDAVIGSRLMGGGFGGCTINIIKNDGKETFLREAVSAYKDAFNIEPEIYEVKIMDGTHAFSKLTGI